MAKRGSGRRRAEASSSLAELSYADIQRELQRRARGVFKLVRKRDALMRKVAALEGQIEAAGGSSSGGLGAFGGRGRGGARAGAGRKAAGAGGGRTRPKNELNLVEALQKLLKDQTLSVTDAAEQVQKAGYQTTSPNFRTIVNQTLINHEDVFKRVGRGLYTVK